MFKKTMLKNTLFITRVALLTSLCIVTNSLIDFRLGPSAANAISFTYIPCFIAGIMLGPIAGGLVGFLGDFLGNVIVFKGTYMPLIGLASTLTGVIPGIIFKFKRANPTFKIVISFFLCLVICTSGLNSYSLWLIIGAPKGVPFWTFLIGRLPMQFINIFVNCIIMLALLRARFFAEMLGEKRKSASKKAAAVQTVSDNAEQITTI